MKSGELKPDERRSSSSTAFTEQLLPPLPSTLPEYDNVSNQNEGIQDIIEHLKTDASLNLLTVGEDNCDQTETPLLSERSNEKNLKYQKALNNNNNNALSKRDNFKGAAEKTREYQRQHFSNEPPISLSTTTFQLQNFISSTTQFINSYVANATTKLDEFSDKLDRLDRQICILESKNIITFNQDDKHT